MSKNKSFGDLSKSQQNRLLQRDAEIDDESTSGFSNVEVESPSGASSGASSGSFGGSSVEKMSVSSSSSRGLTASQRKAAVDAHLRFMETMSCQNYDLPLSQTVDYGYGVIEDNTIFDNNSDCESSDGESSVYSDEEPDSEISDDGEFEDLFDNEQQFNELLAQFCLTHLKDQSTNELLHLLRNTNKFPNLPSNHGLLYGSYAKRMPPPVAIKNGHYLHLGIQENLKFVSAPADLEELLIDISWDGVNLHKSASTTMWPLSMRFVNIPNAEIMLVGIFIGKKKPANALEYFYCLVKELENIHAQGYVLVGPDKKELPLKIRCFISDTPAKIFAIGKYIVSLKSPLPPPLP